MKKYLFYFSMVFVVVVLFFCKSGKKSVFILIFSGCVYEVFVVVEKFVWECFVGRVLYNVFDIDVFGFL